MSTRILGIGVIGCGAQALSVHLPALARQPAVRVVALAEPDADRLAAAGGRAPGARRYRDYRELLEDPAVDAVVVSVPTALHAAVALAALERRKHLYLEKPLAAELPQGVEILHAWRATSVVGMVGFNFRHHPLVQEARRLLAAGAVGAATAIRSVFCIPARAPSSWRCERTLGGGAFLELGSHHVDLIRFLSGAEIDTVCAPERRLDGAEAATVELHLQTGLQAQMLLALGAPDDDRIEVHGTAGRVVVDRYLGLRPLVVRGVGPKARLALATHELRGLSRLRYALAKLRAPGQDLSYAAALRAFADAARSGAPAAPDLEDGFRALEAVVAAMLAAREHRPVALAELSATGRGTVSIPSSGTDAL